MRIFAALVLLTLGVHAVAEVPIDLPGSADHPLISRFPNTAIVSFRASQFEKSFVVSAPMDTSVKPAKHNILPFSGHTTSITYRAATHADSVNVIADNYLAALKTSGFQTIFSCRNDNECGARFAPTYYWYYNTRRQGQHKYLDAPNLHGARSSYVYYSGSVQTGSDPTYIEILIAGDTAGKQRPIIVVDIYESSNARRDEISINIDKINRDIDQRGRVVLEGLYFDTNSAKLKAESNPSLKTVAEYLFNHPTQYFYVVGHTDNDGSFEHNIELSKSRAASVIKQLQANFLIDPTRLLAIGVGPTNPLHSNQTDSGREGNRRVELVLQ